jgi:tetratricopeptide (TPR) repeat protein
MESLNAGELSDALEFFSKAIELDPNYSEAYHSRSEVLTRLGRRDEADADIQKVKSLKSKQSNDNSHKNIKHINLNNVENVYEDLTLDVDDELDFEDDLYDYVFSDDTLESDSLLESLATPQTKSTGSAAILEYLNGKKSHGPIFSNQPIARLLLSIPKEQNPRLFLLNN